MVVLDAEAAAAKARMLHSVKAASVSPPVSHAPSPYLNHNIYVQPLPQEFDSKNNPLAMLTRACNKIESDMLSAPGVNTNNNRMTNGGGKIKSVSPLPYAARPSSKSPSGIQQARPKSNSSTTSSGSPSPKSAAQRASPAAAAAAAAASSAALQFQSLGFPPHMMAAGFPGMPNPAHAQCTDPRCPDPSCPTNQMKAAAQQMQASYAAAAYAAAVGRPAYPMGYPGMPGMPGMPGLPPAVSAAAAVASAPSPASLASLSRPASAEAHVCNWMQGSAFCGRRFSNGEDLMAHLRSHTATSAAAAAASEASSLSALQAHAAAAAAASSPGSALAALQAQAQAVMAASTAAAATTASKSSISSAASTAAATSVTYSAASDRFHPYGRPGGLPMPGQHMGSLLGGLPHPFLGMPPAPGASPFGAFPYPGMPPLLYP